ncbi:MAG: LptA/OstA family protein [Myxococcota bacterium]
MSAARGVLLALLAACAPSEPAAPLPTAAVATGVEAVGEGWSAAAATLRFGANVAEAAEPAIVRATDGKPPLEITAARSEWDLKARTARFSGTVDVRRGGVTMRCDSLDVRYADADRIDRVVATGNVLVRQGARTANAATAELVGATGQITLTGTPKLAEGPNTLVGNRIVLWLDDERASCEGAGGEPCRLVVEGSALK